MEKRLFTLKRNDGDELEIFINKSTFYPFKVTGLERPEINKPYTLLIEYYGDPIEFESRLFDLVEAWANHKNWRTPRIPKIEPRETPLP